MILFVALSGLSSIATANHRGHIRGVVTDPSGAMVRDATSDCLAERKRVSRVQQRPTGAGAYVLLELPVGERTLITQLEVQAKIFQKYVQQGICAERQRNGHH